MTITNHVLAGAVIAATIRYPLVAIPVSFLSHFTLDAVPHFGGVSWYESWNKRMMALAVSDAALSIILLAFLTRLLPAESGLMAACALFATLPDWPWVLHYKFGLQHRYFTFHQAIQRYERPWGAYVEIVFAVFLCAVLYVYAHG
jgi:hypothetical protein